MPFSKQAIPRTGGAAYINHSCGNAVLTGFSPGSHRGSHPSPRRTLTYKTPFCTYFVHTPTYKTPLWRFVRWATYNVRGDEILRSKTNARYCADMPRDYLLVNIELIRHVSELSKQIEKGIDRNRREGALRLREMEKSKVKTESNKQTKNKRLSQVAFEGGKKKLEKMGKVGI
eukprot:gene14575-596_t